MAGEEKFPRPPIDILGVPGGEGSLRTLDGTETSRQVRATGSRRHLQRHFDNHLQLKDRLLIKSRRHLQRRNGLHLGATNQTWIPHLYKELGCLNGGMPQKTPEHHVLVFQCEYAQKLPASVRSRYEEKVLMCGGKDPLSLSDDETVTDTSAYPKVEECDVKDYLVDAGAGFSGERVTDGILLAFIVCCRHLEDRKLQS
ncbi:hypothetical protein HPB47_018063 [Ixodes persulcatus]|uniref:Uncharacterized protein n=1 Tax=Ixodes persulcatus TaxID=34615 RepID=A0AC60QLN3_IXOPE|nr:hypothetical protein HPB47_018063 [Ixodes persulcatus]